MPNLPIQRCIALMLAYMLAMVSFTARADTELFSATYQGKYGGIKIETERRLIELDDGTYRLESKASNFLGSLSESSHFAVENDQWRPLQYVYKRRILGARTTEAIAFDWDSGSAHYTHSGKPERNTEHKLQPDVLDPALYQLRIQRDLALDNNQLVYHFIKRDRIRLYKIERLAGEELGVDGQAYSTIKIQRADTEADKQTYVWVIPELDYLIGKIVHLEEDGDAHQMLLSRYSLNEKRLDDFFRSGDTGDSKATVSTGAAPTDTP